jgi:hypothetical protein
MNVRTLPGNVAMTSSGGSLLPLGSGRRRREQNRQQKVSRSDCIPLGKWEPRTLHAVLHTYEGFKLELRLKVPPMLPCSQFLITGD